MEINKNLARRDDLHLGKNVTIEENVTIGKNVLIEDNCYICSGAKIGDNCKIHRNVFIDYNVEIGNNVKIQNNNSIYHGVVLEDGTFVGTNVSFTNDKFPRSINPDGSIKTGSDWVLIPTIVKYGASIGSGATIVCGNEIGSWAMVAAGAVVTRTVEPYTLVAGCPAKEIRKISEIK